MEQILKKLWFPAPKSHKGQNGKLLIIGGSRKYHGAPVFSILAARRFVDLLYFYPGENDPQLIKAVKRIPEAMVVYDLKRLSEMDCVLFGIGLADAKFDVRPLLKKAKKLVIDGDGLMRVKGRIPAGAILTPHENEFKLLFGKPGTMANVAAMARKYEVTILKKDPNGDIISNGRTTLINRVHNAGMTKGGTGDVLAGLCAALFCKNDALASAYVAAYVNGYAGNILLKKFGHNFAASDLADELAPALQQLKKV
jgi:NAD(P)H-hydrate epimerase